jgi:N-glycosylase/DNA lyase
MYSIKFPDIDLDHTLDCGQVFRWSKNDGWWTGVVRGHIVRLQQKESDGALVVDSDIEERILHSYLRLDDDLQSILSEVNLDPYINGAIQNYYGLRLIRQEPWECFISYMLATASSIPRIQKNISMLCSILGEEIRPGYYSFPSASALASASCDQLCDCKMGFRTSRIIKAARNVISGDLVLEGLFELDYESAKKELMGIDGIGEKVADCILIFSLDKMEAFPVDTHVEKLVRYYYGEDPFFNDKVTKGKIGAWGRHYFGKYCGYAQQYLFHHKRMEGLMEPPVKKSL